MDKEKKEIGMEKLIELLNEYDSSNGWKETDEGIDNIWKIYEFHSELQIISKKYGFIKWLLENDKIDIVKVYENLTNYEIEIRIRAVKELLENNEEDTIAYLKLLMLLAIQDESIRFLCEIIN